MFITCNTLWLPRQSNSIEEYEDAAAPTDTIEKSFDTFQCAVADGAAESSFSGVWARLLVNGYIERFDLPKLQSDWLNEVARNKLLWYAEEKAQMGAFAAFAGLTIYSDKKWEAKAIGDSCIVQVRNMKIIQSMPLTDASQFNNTPFLLSSNEQSNKNIENFWVTAKGTWKPHDVFLLMTDALAMWLLSGQDNHENMFAQLLNFDKTRVEYLLELTDQNSFVEFIEQQRSHPDNNYRMKNDDVTLMKVAVTTRVDVTTGSPKKRKQKSQLIY